MIRIHPLVLLAVAFLGTAPASFAQAPVEPVPQASAPIAPQRAASEDGDIAARIRGIFKEIGGLQDVTVEVAAGVVSLDGSVTQPEEADRAEAIAQRVAGVVTVENNLQRDFGVDANVAPALGRLRDDLRGLRQALPLFAVALALGVLVAVFGQWLARRKRFWARTTSNLFLAELAANSVRAAFFVAGAVIVLEILGATALLGAVLGGRA